MISIEESKVRWEFFQKHLWVSPEFSLSPIFHSWQRCIKQMSAYDWSKPHIASGFTLTSLKRRAEQTINCATTIVEDTYDLLDGEELLLFVTDDNGCVMFVIGDLTLQDEMRGLGIKEQCFLSEDNIGTNAISFALDTNMPSIVFAGEHFKRDIHHIVTVSAPIIDVYGRLLGTVSIIRHADKYNSEDIVVASSCAREVGMRLHINSEQENMNRLQSAHAAALDYIDDGVISWDGNNIVTYVSQQVEKITNIHSNDLFERDIFDLVRFSPNILSCIRNMTAVRRKKTTFEINGLFIEAIVTYHPVSDDNNLLFLHPSEESHDSIEYKKSKYGNYTFDDLPITSDRMKKLVRKAKKAIKDRSPILISGEDGVGKADFAMAIHNESEYHDGPFITFNCRSSNPYQLVRDVLGFDENNGRPSKFEMAKKGTLYIEHIESLGNELQKVLLKLLKTGLVSRSDSQRLIKVDFNLVTSTSEDVGYLISQGEFSRHLYYELSANELHISPIRNRKEDVEHIIKLIIEDYSIKHGVAINLDNEVLDVMLNYRWPGNNSEIYSVFESVLLNRKSNLIGLDDVPDSVRHSLQDKDSLKKSIVSLDEVEKNAIIHAWNVFDGRINDITAALNIGRTTLWRKVKKYKITNMDV